MIANYAAMDIKPGSMGRPLPGIEATVLERDAEGDVVMRDGEAVEVTEPGVEGELALRPGWPSMFRGYLHEEERYAKCFAGGWYLTGDLVRRDADGYYWFVGRGDDVIKTSGHLIGPFEVESVLLEHPAVAEAGVIGVPDPVAGEVVKAFVLLAPGYEPTEALRTRLMRPRAQAPRRRGRAARDRVRRRRCRTRAAARSCAACSRPASSACPRATPRRWSRRHDPAVRRRRAARARARPAPAARDAAHPPLRGGAAPSSTRRRRSAASCTSTSARRRSPSARCRR